MNKSYLEQMENNIWDFIDKIDEKDTHEEIIEYLREGIY